MGQFWTGTDKRFARRLEAERRHDAQVAELRHRGEIARERRELDERPEGLLDALLGLLVRTVDAGLAGGVPSVREQLKDLLGRLARKLGAAFSSEAAVILARLATLPSNPTMTEIAQRLLRQIITEFPYAGAP